LALPADGDEGEPVKGIEVVRFALQDAVEGRLGFLETARPMEGERLLQQGGDGVFLITRAQDGKPSPGGSACRAPGSR